MKYLLFIIPTLVLLCSCIDNKDKIIGQWIEKNNYKAPHILEFSEDYFVKPHNDNEFIKYPYELSQYLYKIKKDSILYYENFGIVRKKININDDELVIHSNYSDTLFTVYKKNTHSNYIAYINDQLDLSIQLPKGNFYILNWEYSSNTIYMDYDKSDNLIFLLNGEHISVDANMHKKIIYEPRSSVICFADSNILVKDLNSIKIELSKAGHHRAYFGVINEENEIGTVPIIMPWIDYHSNDSLSSLYPPPRVELSFFKEKPFALIEIAPNEIKVNGEVHSQETLKDFLQKRIIKENRTYLFFYYSNNLKLQDYVNFATNISYSLESIKQSYFESNYKKDNYWELNDEEKEEFDDTFKVAFNEILKEDLVELYNYLKLQIGITSKSTRTP